MGTRFYPITATPEIVVLWEGTNIEEYGIRHLLKEAVIGTTCKRVTKNANKGKSKPIGSAAKPADSKRPRYYTRRRPKVSAASLDFIVPDQNYATLFMELMSITARPKITIGFRIPEVAQGKGIYIGTYTVDTMEWNYPASDFVSFKVNGKTDKYLNLKKYKAPRVFEDKTAIEIIKTVAEEHKLKVKFENQDSGLDTYKLNLIKPAGEDDYQFLERVAEIVGISGFHLTTSPSNTFTSESISASSGLLRGDREVRSLAEASRSVSRGLSPLSLVNTTPVLEPKLSLSKSPTYLHNSDTQKVMPELVIAYGPGIDGQEIDDSKLVLKASEMRASAPQSGPSLTSSAKVNEENKFNLTKLLVEIPGVVGGPSGTNLAVVSSLASAIASKNEGKKPTKSKRRKTTPFEHGPGELPHNSPHHRVFVSGCPASVSNDLPIALRNGARARELGYVEEITASLNPGFPFLNAPQEVLVLGTYVYDGMYGVEEVTHTYNASGGLSTQVKMLKIKGSGAKKKPTPPTSDTKLKVNIPGVVGVAGGESTNIEVTSDLSGEVPLKGKQPQSTNVKTSHPTLPTKAGGG